jgi:transmembrane sensor
LENKRILKLIAKEQLSVVTEEEQKELDEWIESSPENRQYYDQFTNEEGLDDKNDGYYGADASWKRFEQNYYGAVSLNDPKRSWRRKWYAVAAGIILVLSIGSYLLYPSNKISGKCIAVIKRSDGTILKVYDSEKKILTDENGVEVVNEGNGALKYNQTGNSFNVRSEMVDTITTPVGEQCEVTLTDGSRVWLNARSKLIVPVTFNEKVRLVTLSGEGYFEVNSKNSPVLGTKVPFVVNVNGSKVEVLGTRFNVMAYENELTTTTTLYEGAVKLVTMDSSAVLKPGQQVFVNKRGGLSIVNAWKNGEMRFEDNSLEEIMLQVSRWYNIEFVCEGNCGKHFKITLLKTYSLTSVLQALENTGSVHFKIEGKKIIAR